MTIAFYRCDWTRRTISIMARTRLALVAVAITDLVIFSLILPWPESAKFAILVSVVAALALLLSIFSDSINGDQHSRSRWSLVGVRLLSGLLALPVAFNFINYAIWVPALVFAPDAPGERQRAFAILPHLVFCGITLWLLLRITWGGRPRLHASGIN